MPSYVAALRVYEPVSAFPPDEREHWTAYARSEGAGDRVGAAQREHEAALGALLAAPPRPAPPAAAEEAFVRRHDGELYVCPWRTRLRSWLALAEFRSGLPDELADAFVPRAVAESAEGELAAYQASHPQVRPHILTSTWQVPLPWFLPFAPEERRLVLGARGGASEKAAGAGRTGAAGGRGPGLQRALVYLTSMTAARQRLARALHVLRRAYADAPASGAVEELGRWLEEFHPHGLVELDYGGLVHLLDDDALAGDDSVAALHAALEQLAAGDSAAATELYEQVVLRWRAVAALESAN